MIQAFKEIKAIRAISVLMESKGHRGIKVIRAQLVLMASKAFKETKVT